MSLRNKINLDIMLTDKCNYSCGHCLVSSSPSASNYRFRDYDVDRVVENINSNPDVDRVGFSGGEPTLSIGLIEEIQNKVSRPITYVMTTNGWFGDSPGQILDRIQLNEIIVSYDLYHAEFGGKAKLLNLLKFARSRGIETRVNSVYKNAEDLADVAELLEDGTRLKRIKLIKSGKSTESCNVESGRKQVIENSCPSLIERSNSEKLTYFPGKGFSICCGPLTSDGLGDDEFMFSTSTFEAPPIHHRHRLSLRMQYEELGLNVPYGDSCTLCTALYKGADRCWPPSLSSLVSQKGELSYIKTTEHLPELYCDSLSAKFHVAHVYTAEKESIESWAQRSFSVPDTLVVDEDLSPLEIDEFIFENYYQRYSEHYCEEDVAKYWQSSDSYFQRPDVVARGYKKNGDLVGLVMGNLEQTVAHLSGSYFHVGYWGYDRSKMDQQECRWMKRDWFRTLFNWAKQHGLSVDVVIAWFNKSSMKLAEHNGFRLVSLRLQKKSEGEVYAQSHSSPPDMPDGLHQGGSVE